MDNATRLKANKLQEEIDKIEYFLKTIDPDKNVKRGSGEWDIDVVIKTKTTKEFSILGSRWFGLGSHKEEIEFPNELMFSLYELCLERLLNKRDELKNL